VFLLDNRRAGKLAFRGLVSSSGKYYIQSVCTDFEVKPTCCCIGNLSSIRWCKAVVAWGWTFISVPRWKRGAVTAALTETILRTQSLLTHFTKLKLIVLFLLFTHLLLLISLRIFIYVVLFIYLFVYLKSLYNMFTSSCAHLLIILPSSSSCVYRSSLPPPIPFHPSVL
jgi:hypothetical protein